jgi:hypothetical protein
MIRNLQIPLISSYFQAGLVRATSDNKPYCKLFGTFQVPIIAGFDWLIGIVEFDWKDYLWFNVIISEITLKINMNFASFVIIQKQNIWMIWKQMFNEGKPRIRQTYQRFLRWTVFSSFGSVSQVRLPNQKWIYHNKLDIIKYDFIKLIVFLHSL